MPKFSQHFQISNPQAALDFVDIDLQTDTPLYLDPYAIEIREDEWSTQCGDHIRSFFNAVLDSLRDRNDERALNLLNNLHEPNETFLGQSIGRPSGRGVGNGKAQQFADALRQSRAFATNLLSDVSEAELFIAGVGSDTISDLTTNILRGVLADYTTAQCAIYGIATSRVNSLGPSWNVQRARWEARHYELPVYRGRPIILVPKFSVRFRMSLDSQEFYNKHMIEFLRAEHLRNATGLVHTFKNGRRDVYKKDVKEQNPFVKDGLADFVTAHPEVLEAYKRLKGAAGPLPIGDIEKFFDERAFAEALAERLRAIGLGNDHATAYHNAALGICTFLFHPSLICPVKEQEIHEGRKRIDIKFTNAAQSGFFDTAIRSDQLRAMSIAMECKNYSKEINNPELDQLAGRFGHQRGRLGFLLCRSMDNRQRFVARCRDTANDERGYIIVMEDDDLLEMLSYVAEGRRSEIDRYLHRRLAEITH